MAQEIQMIDGKPSIQAFNSDSANKYIRLHIIVKNVKAKKGNVFKSVKGLMYLPIYEETGYTGKKESKWLDVHFKKDAFKDFPECSVHSIDDLKTGDLYVLATCVQAPNKYQITKDDEGKDVYPSIWVKGGIVGFIPYTVEQSAFDKPDYLEAQIEPFDAEADAQTENEN